SCRRAAHLHPRDLGNCLRPKWRLLVPQRRPVLRRLKWRLRRRLRHKTLTPDRATEKTTFLRGLFCFMCPPGIQGNWATLVIPEASRLPFIFFNSSHIVRGGGLYAQDGLLGLDHSNDGRLPDDGRRAGARLQLSRRPLVSAGEFLRGPTGFS